VEELLSVNAIVEWLAPDDRKGEMFRVLYFDKKEDQIVIFPLPGDKDFPFVSDLNSVLEALNNGEAFIRPNDPYGSPKQQDSQFKKKDLARRDRAWRAIEELVHEEPEIYCFEGRGKKVAAAARRAETTKKYIIKWMRAYWRRGKVKNALLPSYENCGGKGKEKPCPEECKRGRRRKIKTSEEDFGVNITDLDKSIILLSINNFYNLKESHSIRKTYDWMMAEYYNKGYEVKNGTKFPILPPVEERMTIDQFRYWFRKILDLKKSLVSRKGTRGFNLRHREILKSSTLSTSGPGHTFQIDATIADVYVVSSLNRTRIIGRPVLYFVVCVFTRMIVGFYVGLEGPSYLGAAMALFNTAVDKVELCSRYGIVIEKGAWPSFGFSQYLIADRGEMISNITDQLVNGFDTRIVNTPPYRADFKGIVEQQFRRANIDMIEWAPGSIDKRFRERGERDHRLDAKLTIDEFTTLIIHMILNHNKNHYFEDYPLSPEMNQDGVKPVPLDLWDWGMENCIGHIRHWTTEELIRGLMPTDTASIQEGGIKFKNLFYTCDRAHDEAWFTLARNRGRGKAKVSYDPRRMDRIFLHDPHGNELIECRLLEKSEEFGLHRVEDVEEFFFEQKPKKRKHSSQEMQGNAEFLATMKEITGQAEALTNAALERSGDVSDASRVANIRENRAEERKNIGEKEAFDPIKQEEGSREFPGENCAAREDHDHVDESDELDVLGASKASALDMLKSLRG